MSTALQIEGIRYRNTVSNSKIIQIDSYLNDYKPAPEKTQKLKKDGTPKNIKCNKKKGKKSEVYPFQIEDVKKMMNYFRDTNQWLCYLLFVLGCNMARRVGDTLSLKWENIYFPDGTIRDDILEIKEDKTDKLANPRINSACRQAIELYVKKTNCNPSENNYQNYIFLQLSGSGKGKVLSADGYRKSLKKGASEVGIKYNVGTHSTRKTFGMLNKMLHPSDYDSMEILQTIFNHSDAKTTKHYIGLTKQKVDKYYDDMGNFFDEYITGEKEYIDTSNTPITSIETSCLRDIIKSAYELGMNNADVQDISIHLNAINKLMEEVETNRK